MTPSRNAVALERRTPRLSHPDEDDDEQPLRRRPRRNWLNWRTALLTAIVTCAVGFYAGVRVEKGQLASTPRTFSLSGAGGASGRASGAGAGASGQAASSGRASATGAGAATGATTGRAGGFAGGGVSVGTVQSVNGNALVLSETSGTTVQVRLASSTKVTKNTSVKRSAVRPGDTLIVQGAPNAKGTVVASTVTDSGAGGTGLGTGLGGSGGGAGGATGATGAAGGSGSRAGGSHSGGGSAVGSLFSGGGG
jgi:hypothetical protein